MEKTDTKSLSIDFIFKQLYYLLNDSIIFQTTLLFVNTYFFSF